MTPEQRELIERFIFLNDRIKAELDGWELLCADYAKRKVELDNARGRLHDLFDVSTDTMRDLNVLLATEDGENWWKSSE